MKYTSKEIQEILKSKTAIEGLDYITPVYHKAKTALWIMEAMGVQGDLFVKWVNEMVEQILPQTATWTLDYWEEEYGLPVQRSGPDSQEGGKHPGNDEHKRRDV